MQSCNTASQPGEVHSGVEENQGVRSEVSRSCLCILLSVVCWELVVIYLSVSEVPPALWSPVLVLLRLRAEATGGLT